MKRLTCWLALLLGLLLLAGCGTPVAEGLRFRTADPNLTITFVIPQPDVVAAEEVGETEPDPPLPAPCDYMEGDVCQPIKGNISKAGEKIAHAPGQANYGNVLIDESAGEKFFRTMEEAVAAGWRAALR